MCSISHDLITSLLPISLWFGGGGGGGFAVAGLVIVSCSKGLNFQINFWIFCCLHVALKLSILFSYWKSCQRLHLRDPRGVTLPK